MKLINNKMYLVLVFMGLFNILLGAFERLKIIPSSSANPGIPLIVAGIIILSIGLYYSRKPEREVMLDERIKSRQLRLLGGRFWWF